MNDKANAIVIDIRDNVATVICQAVPGMTVSFFQNGVLCILQTSGAPIYHKIAIMDIPKGMPILKYGEVIGVATEFIPKGAHVHNHNITSVTA